MPNLLAFFLFCGPGAIFVGGGPRRDRRKSGSIIVRIVRLPRLISEPQPQPRALFISRGLLLCPHVIQGRARVVAELPVLRVIARKAHGFENGSRPGRLDRLVTAAIRIAVERRNFLPKPYPLRDIVQESAFDHGRNFFRKRFTKGRPRERVRHRRMTRHAKGFVIARGLWPFHPPTCPSIEVSGCSPLIPGARDFRFRPIEVSRYSLRISGVGGASFRAPTDRNDSGDEASRQSAYRLHACIHRDRLPLRTIRKWISPLRTRRKKLQSNVKRLPRTALVDRWCSISSLRGQNPHASKTEACGTRVLPAQKGCPMRPK